MTHEEATTKIEEVAAAVSAAADLLSAHLEILRQFESAPRGNEPAGSLLGALTASEARAIRAFLTPTFVEAARFVRAYNMSTAAASSALRAVKP